MAMIPKVKERWLEALRGGAYKQTQGVLRDEYGFCCLGVLCDILKDDGVGEWKTQIKMNGETIYKFDTGVNASTVDLTGKVMEASGLNSFCGTLPDKKVFVFRDEKNGFETEYQSLVELNDHSFSFKEIADIIEKSF